MKPSDLKEFHYIAPIENAMSILELGILSHRRSERVEHISIANEEIQIMRDNTRVPRGLPLHDYVNLYFHARNPMLYCLVRNSSGFFNICIFRIDKDIIKRDGVVVTDQNAARGLPHFRPFPEGLKYVDYDLMLSGDWNDPDQIQKYRKKGRMCAEILVPYCVDSKYIVGAYVSCASSEKLLAEKCPDLSIEINPYMYFR